MIIFRFPDIAEDYPYPSKKRTMQRVKKNGSEPDKISSGIKGMYDILSSEEWTHRLIYSGGRLQLTLITDYQGYHSLIIWDPEFFKWFKDSEMIAIDGTFSRVPLIEERIRMHNYQLITIIAVKENVVRMKP